jgi:hypothetical protein
MEGIDEGYLKKLNEVDIFVGFGTIEFYISAPNITPRPLVDNIKTQC